MKKISILLPVLLITVILQLNAQDKNTRHFKGEELSAKIGLLSRLQQPQTNNGKQLLRMPLSETPLYGSGGQAPRHNTAASRSASDTDYGFNSTIYQGVNVPLQSTADGLGNVYTTGVSADAASPKGNFVTVKTDAAGNIAWVAKKPIAEFAVEYGTAITLDAAANPVATGMHWNGTDMDVHTVKMDAASGTVIWAADFNGAAGGLDIPSAVTVDGAGNTIVAGITFSGTSIRYLVLKYSAAGILQWSYTDDNATEDVWNETTAIAVDASGNIAVTGYGASPDYYQTYYTVKLNASGNKLWDRNYTFQVPSSPEDPQSPLTDVNSIANDVQFDATGNCYVTGIMNTAWGTMGTIKYDPDGNQQWMAAYQSGTDNTTAHQLRISGNAVYVSGRHMGDWFEDGLVLISYDTAGNENWTQETIDLADARIPRLLLDTAGRPVISGYGYDENGNTLFKTLRYGADGNVATESAYLLPAVATESLGGLVGLSLDSTDNLYLSLAYTYTETGQVFKVVKMPFAPGSPALSWNSSYSGNALNNKWLLASAAAADGSIYNVGSFGQIDGENYIINYYLEQYGPAGNIAWQKVFNAGNGNDSNGIQLQVTPNSEAVVYLIPFGFGDPLKLKKYDAAGNLAWEFEKTVYEPSFGAFFTDSTGNVYLSGAAKENEAAENPVFTTVKVSAAGQEQWTAHTPSSNVGDTIYRINAGTAGTAGSITIAGTVGTGSFFSEDVSAAVIRYDSDGAQQWFTATPTAGLNTSANSLFANADGSIIVNGAVSDPDTGQEKMMLRKYDASGQQQWESIVGEEGRNVRSYKALPMAGGEIVAAAFSVIYGVNNKVLAVRFDANGNQVVLYETELENFYRDIATDGTNVYLLTQYYGTTLPYRIFYSAGAFYAGKVIKITADNASEEENLVGPALSPFNPANFVTKDNSLLVPGTLESDAFVFQGVYFFESGFEMLGVDIPEIPGTKDNWLGQNYPNPAVGNTFIPVYLQNTAMVNIGLYDITGRLIRQLYSGNMPQGRSDIRITTAGLPTGIYVYKGASDAGSLASRKLIVK